MENLENNEDEKIKTQELKKELNNTKEKLEYIQNNPLDFLIINWYNKYW